MKVTIYISVLKLAISLYPFEKLCECSVSQYNVNVVIFVAVFCSKLQERDENEMKYMTVLGQVQIVFLAIFIVSDYS